MFGIKKIDKHFNLINEESKVIKTQEELMDTKRKLKVDKHACLFIRVEPPSGLDDNLRFANKQITVC